MRAFFGGFVLALILVAVAGVAAVLTGVVPARQDVKPGMMERWAAKKSLAATMRREVPQPPYPIATPDEAGFVKGATLYVQNCAVCHGTAHSTPTAIAQGFAIHAPQFAKHGVDDDPVGETYWKIDHGIRFTAMPAFDQTMDQQSIWQIAYFLKNLPALPPRAKAVWENPSTVAPPTPAPVPSRSPGEGPPSDHAD
ncbi:MAG TPA: cytochrome c [Candidatus Sulfotelmatobacter sp.]|nr:cytochrome c [Candidatus Sulfotelmatobacter sp.]